MAALIHTHLLPVGCEGEREGGKGERKEKEENRRRRSRRGRGRKRGRRRRRRRRSKGEERGIRRERVCVRVCGVHKMREGPLLAAISPFTSI